MPKKLKLGVVMDPIAAINIQKDSTFAMLLEAQRRKWHIHYMLSHDLSLRDGKAWARMAPLSVKDNPKNWYRLSESTQQPLNTLDVILMRKDPPIGMDYMHATYILEQAEHEGVSIINRPQALRDANEKLYTAWFAHCCPPTLVAADKQQLRDFLQQEKDIIVKPLDGMGGVSIFRLQFNDPNVNVILETLTHNGKTQIMAQRYIPEISEGDKRILLIDGEPIPYGLARIAAPGETRANLATGGHGVGIELSERDLWISHQVGAKLKDEGLIFAGLDIIGNYLTEINVTSPTCIREIDAAFSLNIAGQLMDCIEKRVENNPHLQKE